ncbi:MAG: PLP-dependent transferase, partial [Bdellovibrionales bacterium]|nr:PLP-dependent transferase [Bdellovibrionales bacterium]
MSELNKQGFSTKAVHAGVVPDPTTGAIMTPIYATSTYVQASPGKHKGFEYSRTGNPTRRALEQSLAALESGKFGFALSSGCTGVDLCMHLLQQGDH